MSIINALGTRTTGWLALLLAAVGLPMGLCLAYVVAHTTTPTHAAQRDGAAQSDSDRVNLDRLIGDNPAEEAEPQEDGETYKN